MVWHRRPAVFLLLLAVTLADNGVHIRSEYKQLVTSSTLQWVAGESGTLPPNSVVGAHEVLQGASVVGLVLPCAYLCTQFLSVQTMHVIL